ncbi:MAG: thioredoxin fold domain-containing protein, partial [Pelagibacteraceae bacterium]
MSWLVKLAVILLCSSALAAQTDTPTQSEPFGIPDWFKASFLDLSEDNAEAQEDGKHLLVLFTQDFCPYCKALIEKNLTQKTIRDKLDKDFDIVHLNMWGDREVYDIKGVPTTEKAIAKTLQVQFTPTLIFFDSDGEPALRTNGYISSTEMLASLEFVAKEAYRNSSILEFLKDKPRPDAQKSLNEQGFLNLSFDRYRTGAPVALVFEQTDCLDCDQLHDCVLSKPSFQGYAEPFYTVQLDLWSMKSITLPSGRMVPVNRLAQELKISYTPTIVLLDPDFNEVIRAEAQLRSFHVESLFEYVSNR